jgi:microcystin-dependent protein
MADSTFTQRILLPGDPTSALHAATKQYVDTAYGASMSNAYPAGAVMPFAGSTAPNGWLLCYGQAVSRTAYPFLFAAIGTTYGTGDGSTTFNLPDLRGRVPAGLDNMGGSDAGRLDWANTLGTNGGEQKHTMTLAELVAHTHTTDSPVNFAGSGALQGTQAVAKGTTGSTGSTTPFNVMQPTMLLNYMISTGMGAVTRLWAQGVRTTNLTIPDVSTTVVSGFTAETDPYNIFNTSTGKFTLPVAGLWQFGVLWSFSADVANWNHHAINNETKFVTIASLRTANGPYINTLSGMLECSANDVVSFSMYADTASGATMNYCRFTAVLLGT